MPVGKSNKRVASPTLPVESPLHNSPSSKRKKVKFQEDARAMDDVMIGGTEEGSRNEEDDDIGDVELEVKRRRGAVREDAASDSGDEDSGGDDDSDDENGKSAKKGNADDLEGQEWGNDDDNDLGELDDVDTPGAKGEIPISAFNMDAELEEGDFDDSGTFIRRRDQHAMHDTWLTGLSKTDMKKAKDAQETVEKRRREQELNEQRERNKLGGRESANELFLQMLRLMKPRESVIHSLARLGQGRPKKKREPAWKVAQSRARSGMDVDSATPTVTMDSESVQKQVDIESLTSYADQLLGLGSFGASPVAPSPL